MFYMYRMTKKTPGGDRTHEGRRQSGIILSLYPEPKNCACACACVIKASVTVDSIAVPVGETVIGTASCLHFQDSGVQTTNPVTTLTHFNTTSHSAGPDESEMVLFSNPPDILVESICVTQ